MSAKKESRQSVKQPRDWKTFNKKWKPASDSVNKKSRRTWRVRSRVTKPNTHRRFNALTTCSKNVN